MQIREVNTQDKEREFENIWPIFQEVVSAGDTYAYEPNTTKQEALDIWLATPRKTFVAEEDGVTYGTYYIKTNQAGPGKHVCNCGYMVAAVARGRGLATRMCEHSQQVAKELGYTAMQFNFVAVSNIGAVRLWLKLGYEEVGRLPAAFKHPQEGLVDALVMYKNL